MERANYSQKDLEAFARGFGSVAEDVRNREPDYILAPIVGAVPFVDVLHIVDRHFPTEDVVYLPNSSRFRNRDDLMRAWYNNFYRRVETGDKISLVCLDEVLSGSSAVKGYKQFIASLDERARLKALNSNGEVNISSFEEYRRLLKDRVSYHVIGIGERGYSRGISFRRLLRRQIATVFDFDKVYTIDNIRLNPIRLKPGEITVADRRAYLPEIESFEVTPEYMDFLHGIAISVGQDPENVSPINFSKILEGLELAKKK